MTELGIVYLVGAGPGDPGLLTLRGAEVLRRADVVVHDRLTHPALVSMASERAERVDVGKWPDQRGEQEKINRLLVATAQAGKQVVRLKGGDPFVLGRGGEEALALMEAGVPFEVVPGVTSAVAAPAYAGVPVTHRGLATSFTVVAGHSRSVGRGEGPDDGPGGGTNWEALAALGGTIVVLMGVANRGEIARRLMAGGLAPTTPVAVVRWGTYPEQVSLRASLAGLEGTDVEPPATIVIGQVAGLDLRWYESRPLFGKTVVVTRAAHQVGALTASLSALGARVLEVPAICLAPPADGGQGLARAVQNLRAYAWLVFTSSNGVEKFFAQVPDTRLLAGVRVAAVGPGTAGTLRCYRVIPDLVPVRHLAEGLLEELPTPGQGTEARRLLLPQAAGARPELRLGLAQRGWQVDTVEAYQTRPERIDPRLLDQAKAADAICFASSSAVESYLDQSGPVPPIVACIGPVTAGTARSRGLQVSAEAEDHSLDGLVAALVKALSER